MFAVQVELQLVQPLLTCASELFRQRLELVGIIRRKDQEIQDYKDGGAVLSRRELTLSHFFTHTWIAAHRAFGDSTI